MVHLLNALKVLYDLALSLNCIDGVVNLSGLGLLVKERGIFVSSLKPKYS